MIWMFAVIPGIVVGYAFFLRPVLKALPALRAFYADADGFWQKVWVLCGKSAVIAWAYVLQAIGNALQWIDPIATALGDPDLRQTITDTLQANPKVLGYVLMGISAITLAARLRSFAKGAA
ncbi:hypothetical protein OZ411_01385 [Bradyrhizobium sp. Arg237L]|uniref:hypothetical protein n=1 Tax=Bradyrhizobium sp. Arg237L TaxID=3003352 RepID=UPI00249EB8BE|nr:hypothetical protein [Bradyrhizobium sp. Arg237L]MDI4231466.1 hypothetical protein [Bradyrhizobium sp. Arg237L]